MAARVTGGKRVQSIIAKAGKGGVKQVQVGFFSSARYTEGKKPYVASVAAWNEFGTSSIPPRPFFRNAIRSFKPKAKKFLKQRIDPKRMVLTRELAEPLGQAFQNEIQDSIRDLSKPRNAEATIRQKRRKLGGKKVRHQFVGIETPLIDTGYLRTSVTYRIKK